MTVIKPEMEALLGQCAYSSHARNDELFRMALDKDCSADVLRECLLQTEADLRPESMRIFALLKKILSDMGEAEKAAAVETAEKESFYSREGLSSIDIKSAETAVQILWGSREAAEEAIIGYFRSDPFGLGFFGDRARFAPDRDPMYYIMLSKRYDLMGVYFRELNGKNGNDISLFENKYTFISAVLHNERECVGAMLECGYRPDGRTFAELAAYPGAFEKFRENCFAYYCPQCKSAPSEREFFGSIMSENELYKFAFYVHNMFGTDSANRYFDRIDFPKITTLSASAIWNVLDMGSPFFSYHFDEAALAGLFSDDVRIIADAPNVVYTVDDSFGILRGKNKVYDIRGHEDSLIFFSTNRRVKLFLQQELIFNRSEKCPSMVRSVLSRNNKTLTSLVIRKGLVNEENFGDTVKYLTENHLYGVLDQIYKAEIVKN